MGGFCSKRQQPVATVEEQNQWSRSAAEEELVEPIPCLKPYRPSTTSLIDEALQEISEDNSNPDACQAATFELRRRGVVP